VTHNKKTMELASRMYGVTMQEPGVSSIISATLDATASTDPEPEFEREEAAVAG
jgi:chromosome segregation ATPase